MLASLNLAPLTTSSLQANYPFIENESDDPLLTGRLRYPLTPLSNTNIKVGSAPSSDILLRGLGICEHLCSLSIEGSSTTVGPKVRLELSESALLAADSNARLVHEGQVLRESNNSVALRHGDVVVFGRAHVFRVYIPVSQGSQLSLGMSPL